MRMRRMQTGGLAITEVTMWDDHNYVSYSDTDSQSDYFDGYCLGVRRTVEWIRNDGGDRILVRFGNGIDHPKYRKRLKAICKQCSYSMEERKEEVQAANGDRWTNLWFVLEREAPRTIASILLPR